MRVYGVARLPRQLYHVLEPVCYVVSRLRTSLSHGLLWFQWQRKTGSYGSILDSRDGLK